MVVFLKKQIKFCYITKALVVSFGVLLLLVSSLRAETFNNVEIRWLPDYYEFLSECGPDAVNEFKAKLYSALNHPNIFERNLREIIIYKSEGEVALEPHEKNSAIIVFSAQKSVQELIDSLISQSTFRFEHPALSSVVRISECREIKIENSDQVSLECATRGSGFFIGPDGHIATNAHVASAMDANSIYIHVARKNNFEIDDQEVYKVEVIGRDDFSDLALLRMRLEYQGGFKRKYSFFPTVPFEYRTWAPQLLKTGQHVTLIGMPLGRPLKIEGNIINPTASKYGIRLLYLNAAIKKGFSGGIVLSDDGYVIGVVERQVANEEKSISNAIAIDFYSAQFYFSQLLSRGRVTRDYIIREENNALSEVQVERNFSYRSDPTLMDVHLNFDGVEFVNAYVQNLNSKFSRYGVVILGGDGTDENWIAKINAPAFSLEHARTVVTHVNTAANADEFIPLGQPSGFEESAVIFSWYIRNRVLKDVQLHTMVHRDASKK